MPKATSKATGKKEPPAVFCVLENCDGARIMEVCAATEFLSNISDDKRHLSLMHYAGSLDAAEKLMVLIENKKRSAEGKWILQKGLQI